MKTKLLFSKQLINAFCILCVMCLSFNHAWSQELVKNGTCDEHGTGSDTSNTSDNADAWDMTPNSTLNGGITSPYRYDATNNPDGWRNDALEDALELKYLGMAGSLDEQPGSTSSGNNGTRGVKLYDDGNPVITGSSRRLYQRVVGLTIGEDYVFSIDSRSEAAGTPSEVYILNTEISDENGIDANGYADTSVVIGMDIINDEGAWVTNTMTFTATTTEVVIYIRSNMSIDETTEVFYDNISLQADVLSVDEFSTTSLKVYPNPTEGLLNIQSDYTNTDLSIEIFNLLGAKVLETKMNGANESIDLSHLNNGLYLMKVYSGSEVVITRKIVKQ
ncbi:T9SS type A sorting domain-containing protein [Winogradskyella poriferorum]|uniref:T9SS type A sorting domain-containing protein n=1 Tax=Winogradskyella poriferorum TaxID=307627 RepID=UPI003D65B419